MYILQLKKISSFSVTKVFVLKIIVHENFDDACNNEFSIYYKWTIFLQIIKYIDKLI